MGIENKKETPEELKQEENINYLKKFGEGNDKNDQKLLADSEGGKMMKSAVTDSVNKKLAGVNDPKTKEAISALETELANIPDGPLDEKNAKKLKNAYNQLNNLEAQEFDQDGKQAEELRRANDASKKEYADKLDEAIQKLRDMLKENARVAQENVKKSQEAAKAANNAGENEQKMASMEADKMSFPESVSESPTA